MHTDLKVGTYWGEMGVDFWDASTWKHEVDKHEVCMKLSFFALKSFFFGGALFELSYRCICITWIRHK